MDFAFVSPEQVRSHVDPPPQLTEQSPEQVMWQVEPPLQVTLPLLPTSRLHVAPPVQSALHDSPHVPAHVVWSAHLRVQLWPSHALPVRSQVVMAGQEQLVPLHVGGSPVEPLPLRTRVTSRSRGAR